MDHAVFTSHRLHQLEAERQKRELEIRRAVAERLAMSAAEPASAPPQRASAWRRLLTHAHMVHRPA